MTFLSAGNVTSTRTPLLSFLFSFILCLLFAITSLRKPYCYLLKFTWSKSALHFPKFPDHREFAAPEDSSKCRHCPSVGFLRNVRNHCHDWHITYCNDLLLNTTALLTSILAHFTPFVSEENHLKVKDIVVRIILKSIAVDVLLKFLVP